MNIHPSWQPLFDQYEFSIDTFYDSCMLEVYPPRELVFRVFSMSVHDIRVVLLGQDPYHGEGQAHGLSFSVPTGVGIPPSLQNIFKELCRCFPERQYEFKTGNLEPWFEREKIFLLNAALTVPRACPGTHMKDWQGFTEDVIRYIDANNKTCVFLLLGNFAKAKEEFIAEKARIVKEIHPSPLARGFVGSDVFRRVEAVLGQPINWSVD